MEANNNSYGTSWADQWDYNDPAPAATAENKKKGGNGGTASKYKQKVGEGLGKTKAVASTGMKKAKEGTSVVWENLGLTVPLWVSEFANVDDGWSELLRKAGNAACVEEANYVEHMDASSSGVL
ncbi:hypothetical protein DITRI_Ditri04bG0062600 [Diplodiscus trichospermus]